MTRKGTEQLVKEWFKLWEEGRFQDLPIAENFSHTSPYGTIDGKTSYLAVVEANRDKFLGHVFEIHDLICEESSACIRYTAIQGDFRLEVSEWHYMESELISKIVAYYNIEGEISPDRKIEEYEDK